MLFASGRRVLAGLVLSLLLLLTACAGQDRPLQPEPPARDPWAAADARALAAPPQSRASVQALGTYLGGAGHDEAVKARAIFRWITQNVRYDIEGYRASVFEDTSPEAVLRRGSSVCEGYANLFESLAGAAGLEAATVPGYAKGLGYEAGDRFSGPPNHAWNAVRIGGSWRLVDCTWGAGALDESGVMRRRFEPFFFLAPPERLAYTHHPLDPRWQLLERPFSQEEFERLPYVKVAFFTCGLRLLSHGGCVIESPVRNLVVEIGAPEGVLLLAKLYREEQVGSVPATRTPGGYLFRVLLPADGGGTLRVFAAEEGPPGAGTVEFSWAMDYRVLWEGAGEAAGAP